MSPGFTLLADGLLAVLLLATLVYVARLNRRLGQIRDARQEFEALIARFAAATEQADRSIAGVKAAAAAEGKELQATIDRCRGLREDLTFLTDKANGVADQLEAAIGRARKGTAAPAGAAQAASEAKPGQFPRRPAAARTPGAAQGGAQGGTQGGFRAEARGGSRAEQRSESVSAGEQDLLRSLSSIR